MDEEKLRASLQSTDDFGKLVKILEGIPDRALKMKMLREATCSKDARRIYTALQVLRKMKGRDVAEVVEVCLKAQEERGYGGEPARMLGEIGDVLSYTPLTEALRSKNEEVRVNSADSLKKLGYPAAAQELAIVYTRQFESSDGALRKKSVETLAQLHREGSIGVFARALKDSNGDVRLQALYAFSSLEKQEYLPLLEPLVNDPNPEVAEEAKGVVDGLKGQDN
jgi:HEAT repeat protein